MENPKNKTATPKKQENSPHVPRYDDRPDSLPAVEVNGENQVQSPQKDQEDSYEQPAADNNKDNRHEAA